MAQASDDPYTTVPLRQSLVDRLRRLRPYDTMAWGEFIGELADTYEEQQQPQDQSDT